MRFITCIDGNKLDEMIGTLRLNNNVLFEFNDDKIESCKQLVENLNGECDSIIVGTCLDDNNFDLSNSWSYISKLLPTKTGDVVMQFKIDSDECVFFDFNDFMSALYENNGDLESLASYEVKTDSVVITGEIDAKKFDCAFIVNNDWGKDDFATGSESGVFTSFNDLNTSRVWRS